ncbi:MAG: nickel-dependent lactate racemase [Candidatus Faecivicinus sp.]|nr:nickel-dependent lactate racemase [Candidatus Faecivicinus sp.]
MKLEFGFGTGVQTVELPEKNLMGVLMANEVPKGLMNEEEVVRALNHPIGTPRLAEIVHPGERIAIITSDITRPVPSYRILPPLLDELYAAGCRAEDITLVFALGCHRAHTEEEKKKLAGERAYREIRCVDSDRSDCVHMGKTDTGTPIDITRAVAEADRRICLGNIEYHYFAGYSGGAKAIMPGVSTREAIQANHSKMVDPRCHAGNLDTNPLRQDLEQAAQTVGVDFIVNVVLDEHKQIVKAVAGDLVKAHREGCKFLDAMYLKELDARADIVIVSQGGAPKDLNLYQTQKALDNAKHAVKPGGTIILIGSCKEGLGEKVFEEWMLSAPTPESMIERIGREFQLGGHKAAAIAMVLQNAEIELVSDLEPEFVKKIFLKPAKSAQEALDRAFERLGRDATVLAMPYGGSTLPRVKG